MVARNAGRIANNPLVLNYTKECYNTHNADVHCQSWGSGISRDSKIRLEDIYVPALLSRLLLLGWKGPHPTQRNGV